MRYFLVLLLVSAAGPLMAQAPRTMAFQGVLLDMDGNPYADGSYPLTFKLYTVATGGSDVWTETHPSVPVTDGVFSVILASITPINVNNTFDQPFWLEVTQGTTTFPRQALTASPYALGLTLPLQAKGTTSGAALSIANENTSGGDALKATASSTDGLAGRFEGGRGVYIEERLGVGDVDPVDQVDIIAPPGRDLMRVRIDGVGTKFRIHDNGGTSVGANATPPADGLVVQGEIEYNQPQTRWVSVNFDEDTYADQTDYNIYLPHGAVITEMQAWVRDIVTNGRITLTMKRRSLSDGSVVPMAFVGTDLPTGTTGILTDDTIDHATVDNSAYAYFLEIGQIRGPNTPYPEVKIARITYTTTSPLH